MIEHLRFWIDKNAPALRERGFTVNFESGAATADKASAWVDVDSSKALGQLILWETGELDLRVGARNSAELRINEHREIETTDELEDALRDLFAAL